MSALVDEHFGALACTLILPHVNFEFLKALLCVNAEWHKNALTELENRLLLSQWKHTVRNDGGILRAGPLEELPPPPDGTPDYRPKFTRWIKFFNSDNQNRYHYMETNKSAPGYCSYRLYQHEVLSEGTWRIGNMEELSEFSYNTVPCPNLGLAIFLNIPRFYSFEIRPDGAIGGFAFHCPLIGILDIFQNWEQYPLSENVAPEHIVEKPPITAQNFFSDPTANSRIPHRKLNFKHEKQKNKNDNNNTNNNVNNHLSNNNGQNGGDDNDNSDYEYDLFG